MLRPSSVLKFASLVLIIMLAAYFHTVILTRAHIVIVDAAKINNKVKIFAQIIIITISVHSNFNHF